jgi:acetyltransferase-like isoleucine patch superfamily enzyme
MNLTGIVEKLIGSLKSDANYHFETNLSNRELFWSLYYRSIQVLRGMRVRMKLLKSGGVLFAGRNVVIEHGYRIEAEHGLILEDNVAINALSENGIRIGRNVTIKSGAVIVCSGVVRNKGEGLTIGNGSAVGTFNYLAAQGGIEIGNDVIIGPGVMIFSEDHNFSNGRVVIKHQGEARSKVVIEDNCWIGAGVTILKGVRIGRGSVIAAGSVVKQDVAANSLMAGIPARFVKERVPAETICPGTGDAATDLSVKSAPLAP